MVTKEDFIAYCDSLIKQEDRDRYDKKARSRYKWLIIVLLIEAVALIVLVSSFGFKVLIVGSIVVVVSIIVVIALTRFEWNEFKYEYAETAIKYLLKDYSLSYNPNGMIGENIFDMSGFGGSYDSYSGEDLLYVCISGRGENRTELTVCDLYITRTETNTRTITDSDGRTRTEEYETTYTVYKGVFGRIRFPIGFKCNVTLNLSHSGLKKIKLEDIKFNKAFTVRTDNQLEAVVILTPVLMNKLIEFKKRVKGFVLFLSEKGDIFFGYKNNLFELKKKYGKPSGKAFERFYEDILDLMLMIKEIENNEKVFKIK